MFDWMKAEKKTISSMIAIYCRAHHKPDGLCADCAAVQEYTFRKLELCSFGRKKPACRDCKIHCYELEMCNRIRAVMRYSGPRLIVHSPLLAIRHVILSNPRLSLIYALMAGMLTGLGCYTFIYAEGFSYAGSAPEVCVNCHIMQPQYDSWQKSSHHAVARCIDCHLPHNLMGKYIAKAENGYHHSKAFTLQNFNEPIMIKTGNSRILAKNCIAMHQ